MRASASSSEARTRAYVFGPISPLWCARSSAHDLGEQRLARLDQIGAGVVVDLGVVAAAHDVGDARRRGR